MALWRAHRLNPNDCSTTRTWDCSAVLVEQQGSGVAVSVTGGVTGAEVRRCRAYFPYIHVGPTLQLGSRSEPFFSTLS